jgi:hypothetical protein
MTNAPADEPNSESRERDAKKNTAPVIGPVTSASPQVPPSPPHYNNTQKKCRWTQDPGMFILTLLGLIALVAYTCYTRQLVIDGETSSAEQGRLTRETLVAANRAWLSPTAAEFIVPLESGPNIDLHVIYENTGKFPALGFNHAEKAGMLKIPAGFTDWDHIDVGANRTCDGLTPLDTGPTIYASVHFAGDLEYSTTMTPELYNEVLGGIRVLWLNACFAYRTFDTPHQSAFCYFLLPDAGIPRSKWRFKSCPTGNCAN